MTTQRWIVKVLAETVMGLDLSEFTDQTEAGTLVHKVYSERDFNPLTSDADACMVLDKMAETHEVNLVIRHQRPPQADAADYVGCYFGKSEAFLPMSSAGRRRAICLAALKAVGVNTE